MNKRTVIVVTLIAGVFAIAAPIVAALYAANRESLEIEKDQALIIAREVLRRSEVGADQTESAIIRLIGMHLAQPCSDAAIAEMRTIDIGSSYLQMVGYVSGDKLLCSSLGRHDPPVPLGPADYVTPRGTTIRSAVELSIAADQKFLVVQRGNYAAVAHHDLTIDVFIDRHDVSLGLYAPSSGRKLIYRGKAEPSWEHRPHGKNQSTAFFDGRYVVALVQSGRYDVAAYAALPASYLDGRVRNLAIVLVPIGLLVGLLLAGAMVVLARQQMSLRTSIRQGLKRKEFFMMYQPIVDLKSGRCVGVEALLRWKRADGSQMRPDLFIPVAEEHGLIRLITQRVMDLVAYDITSLIRRYPGFRISFNFSSDDLQAFEIVPALREFLHTTSVDPGNIIVEATERGFLSPGLTRQVIRDIRGLGIQVAIDDFGTGYSSLSYLTTLEVDYLKIDRTFVEAVDTDAATSQVALHIIAMAKSLNLAITAEGVETPAQAEFLRRQGVSFGQGWLFGKPMSIGELERWLEVPDGFPEATKVQI